VEHAHAFDDAARPGKALGATHSDLAFSGNLVIMGNYNASRSSTSSNPAKPVLMQTYLCPASQNDVSVYQKPAVHVVGSDQTAVPTADFERRPRSVSKLRVRGIRVFDIADIKGPSC